MWEKKIDLAFGVACGLSNPPTCWTHLYTWDTAMTEFIVALNGGTDSPPSQVGYAGHTDWRQPTVGELQTILLAPYPCGTSPCIDPIFGPTVASNYWPATTQSSNPASVWNVNFSDGSVGVGNKGNTYHVRAVRDGL